MSFDRNSIYDPFETVTHAAFQNDKFSFRARTWEINRRTRLARSASKLHVRASKVEQVDRNSRR